jgi:hypothetical protein
VLSPFPNDNEKRTENAISKNRSRFFSDLIDLFCISVSDIVAELKR